MLEQRLFDRLVREVAARVLGEPSPAPSRFHQALAAAALGVIGFTVAALFAILSAIGLGIAYGLGWAR